MLIGYARVSTVDQDHSLQIDALNGAGCERIVVETASGAKTDRPELRMLLKLMRAGDVLVVWKLDRLSRSMRQLVNTIEELGNRGIGFKCLTQQAIDTTTSSGRMIFGIFAVIAQFERDLIIERTRAGLEAAKRKGVKLGRQPALSATEIAGVKARIEKGERPVDLARALGVHRATIYRAIATEAVPE